MKMKLILVAVLMAVLAVSADCQAMIRRAAARGLEPQVQKVVSRSNSSLYHKTKKILLRTTHAQMVGRYKNAWIEQLHNENSFKKIAERVMPTTELKHQRQVNKVKTNKFSLAHVTESRITREMLQNHAKNDALCEKWLHHNKELMWNKIEFASSFAALPYWVCTFSKSTPDLLMEIVLKDPRLSILMVALPVGVLTLQYKRVKIAKEKMKSVETELAELAKEHKRVLQLADDVQ